MSIKSQLGENDSLISRVGESLRGGITFGLSSSLIQVLNFLLIPLYTRNLSMADFGSLGILEFTKAMAIAIFTIGIGSALFRFYYHYDDALSRGQVIASSLVIALTSTLALSLSAWLFVGDFLSKHLFGLQIHSTLINVNLTSAALSILNLIPFSIYRAEKKFVQYAGINLTFAFTQSLLIIYLLSFHNQGISAIVYGQLVGTALTTITLFYNARKQISNRFSWSDVKKLLRYGAPLTAVDASGIILSSGGLYFIQQQHFEPKEVAIFNLAIKFSLIYSILVLRPFQMIWPPMLFSVEKKPFAKAFYERTLTYITFLSSSLLFAISLFSSEIIALIAPPEYGDAKYIGLTLMISTFLFVIQNVFNVGILLSKRTEIFSGIFFIQALVCILLWMLLIPNLGLFGAGIAPVIAYFFGGCLSYLAGRKFIVLSYDWKKIAAILFFLAIFSLLGLLSPSLPLAASIIYRLTLFVSFILAPFVLGVWYPDEIVAIRRKVSSLVGAP